MFLSQEALQQISTVLDKLFNWPLLINSIVRHLIHSVALGFDSHLSTLGLMR